ncbi:EFG1 [Sanghuangporus sanghuang]
MGSERAGPSREAMQRNIHENRGVKKRRKVRSKDELLAELPGVQKLKAALRQTRRLLAKDNLAADVRVETERRLKSLESDLRTAELKRKERDMAKRYHKVKFFERRKVLRKIKRARKMLEGVSATGSSESAAHLDTTLFELRAQLNYILNYPKLEKYISLFPPSREKSERNPDLADSQQLPESETDARREQLLIEIKSKMAAGELSGKPELHARNGARGPSISTGKVSKLQSNVEQKPARSGAPSGAKKESSRGQKAEVGGDSKFDRVSDDEFFDVASESETDSSSGSEGADKEGY